ncbi:YciI family protein [Streptomyces anulatus]|uniref:YciI family protein n=3 Tax=Streptomyces TaxID=1883 RepID=UPI002E32B4AA|nr:YciI family protein [Streptomyces anulatus]
MGRTTITPEQTEIPMRYLMTTKPTDVAPDENLFAAMGAFVEELTASGVLLATGGLAPNGVRLVSSGDEITVTDGPFAEAKEAVAGFALIEVRSEEEAVELARRFRRIVGDGESVIQQVFGP